MGTLELPRLERQRLPSVEGRLRGCQESDDEIYKKAYADEQSKTSRCIRIEAIYKINSPNLQP